MKKFVCKVCGYIYEGEAAPAECPQQRRLFRRKQRGQQLRSEQQLRNGQRRRRE